MDYLSVSVVQATALNSERSALSLLGNRLAASVNLIVALGGGWDGESAAGAGRHGARERRAGGCRRRAGCGDAGAA